ncbi:MAG: bifunctional fucokinase/L-fucose-1-P-guanylyltransferase [Verrucomicrobia bacterium]|nr:bifunctional fucokinase/L-fucose-1-P-guanylyltransferase [Verrucomicrobiota bacterium]MBT7700834.1 bifunctional fucokinase/L-fucose-1-P-guanylyltransferase [Verrucomicrobiota bacterium]
MQRTRIQFAGQTVWLEHEGPTAAGIVAFLGRALSTATEPHGDRHSQPPAAMTIRLTPLGAGLELTDGSVSLLRSAHGGDMAERVQGEICRRLAGATDSGTAFHAAALATDNRAIAFPGMMQQGKSTLTAGLVVAGWQYMTDEFMVIPHATSTALAFTRPINLRAPTLKLFAPLARTDSADELRLDHALGCLVHPALLGAGGTLSKAPLAAIVFSSYAPDTAFTLQRLTAAQAGLALMACLVNARNLPGHGFDEITRLARTIPAYRMTYSRLDQPGPQLHALLEPTPDLRLPSIARRAKEGPRPPTSAPPTHGLDIRPLPHDDDSPMTAHTTPTSATERPQPIDRLVSLPEAACTAFDRHLAGRFRDTFVTSDPPGSQLGSGGGTAHLLTAAWQATCPQERFADWLNDTRKLIIHGSGQSRRLPGYAAAGKPLTPIPTTPGRSDQQPDHYLLDLQIRAYESLLRHAPPAYRVMLTCGDVYIEHTHWLPAFPEADVIIFGLEASAEEASHHGVMLCPASDPKSLHSFVQKPSPETLRALERSYVYTLDTGIWLFNERAVMLLMQKCGWDPTADHFAGEGPSLYDLFSTFGPALGSAPSEPDPDIGALTCAVIPLADARFYHFGTNRSLMASVRHLQEPAFEQRSFGHASFDPPFLPVIQHATVKAKIRAGNRHLWIENSTLPADWTLSERHVLTGIPDNDWGLTLAPGCCIDVAPLEDGRLCLRGYGFDDSFRGPLGDPATPWFERPAADWFTRRGIDLTGDGIDAEADIQSLPLFPVIEADAIDAAFVAWLWDPDPADQPDCRARWLACERLSARDLLGRTSVSALLEARQARLRAHWAGLDPETWLERCMSHDLAAAAKLFKREALTPVTLPDKGDAPLELDHMHDRMWRAALAQPDDPDRAAGFEREAFGILRHLIVSEMEHKPVLPFRNVLEDQIVWGRSPIRLDLAGGWTDTPPYCIENGGQVVNLAVDLNGQPPIHVFGRICETPHVLLRSIDLGIDEVITTYEELAGYAQLGSGFAIARAALALAGFEPRFHAGATYPDLPAQLKDQLGGGIELSMVCAIPKGSGLGTSSILAATLLGTISELCGLEWSRADVFQRTTALEQMLTSGGGWQDQVGGITPGLKLVETVPGLLQTPTVRNLPVRWLEAPERRNCMLLYYTGLTRVAHDILGEIVRGLFLNSTSRLSIIREIGANAAYVAEAAQRSSWEDLCEAVRRSWALNQLLDSGTNPAPVQAVIDPVKDYLGACKLLGAGGGGYVLMLAKDESAARRIRRTLDDNPPNERSRFVEPGISRTGFQVTRS